jgi:hypothetical protein
MGAPLYSPFCPLAVAGRTTQTFTANLYTTAHQLSVIDPPAPRANAASLENTRFVKMCIMFVTIVCIG